MPRIILVTWASEDIELFGGINIADTSRELIAASCTTHPHEAASAAANPKLSYRDEERKILESCMWRARVGDGVGAKKVIRG